MTTKGLMEKATPFQRNIGRDMLLALVILVSGLTLGVYKASIVGAVGALILVAWNYSDSKRIDWVMLGAGVVGIGFAILAWYLKDESFVKFRPTFSSGVVSAVSLGLVAIGQSPSQRLFGAMYEMQPKHWRVLDIITVVYTLMRGALNYFVATQFSDATWLWYSTFISKGIGMAYGFGCVAYMLKFKERERTMQEMFPPNPNRPAWMKKLGGGLTRMRDMEPVNTRVDGHQLSAVFSYNYTGGSAVRASFDGAPVVLERIEHKPPHELHEGAVQTAKGPRKLRVKVAPGAKGVEYSVTVDLI
jgi:intracellular septation protein